MCNFLDEPTSPERGGGPRAAWRWGFAVRRIPFGKYLGEFAETPLGSPAGGAGSPLGLTERATAPTPFWRVKGALKGMVVTNSPELSQNRSCMLPLSVSLCSTAPPKGEPSGLLRIRPGLRKTAATYRKPLSQAVRPASSPIGEPGASLPPLGEVPRNGKGGVVGDFELLPFIVPHPLSQAVRPASSPIGEPRWLLRIRPSLYKNIGDCRNPSAAAAAAPLSGARWVPYSSVVVISLTVLAMSKKGA